MDWLTLDSKMLASVAYDTEKQSFISASAPATYTATSTSPATTTNSS